MKKLIKNKYLILTLKLLLIIASFALIIQKSDLNKIANYFTSINPLAILISYLILTFAQVISALRTEFYFKSEHIHLKKKFSIGLYFVGMLFNTILPTGIGGDGYKLYIIGKLTNAKHSKILRILLSERASGLFALLMLIVFITPMSKIFEIDHIQILLAIGFLITIPVYFFGIRKLCKEKAKTAIGAMPYSFIVQLCGVIIVTVILWGLDFDTSNHLATNSYVVLFLISSVLSVLPISIGGVGIRELSFMYGASILGLDSELGVSIAIIYFVINLLCSLNGLIFWHRLEKMYD
jgi:uncharacterized membrane protein YbhN (UPF0104 family)